VAGKIVSQRKRPENFGGFALKFQISFLKQERKVLTYLKCMKFMFMAFERGLRNLLSANLFKI
jgi:hypothetical protein